MRALAVLRPVVDFVRALFRRDIGPFLPALDVAPESNMLSKLCSLPALAAMAVAAAIFAAPTANAQSVKKSGPAGGGSEIITGSSFDAIVASLERAGFMVELSKDSDGDPMIESTD